MLIADKGYDANALREAVAERGAWANIPPKPIARTRSASANISIGAQSHRALLQQIKHLRRIATRYDKLAETSSPPSSSPPYASGCVNRVHSLGRPGDNYPAYERQPLDVYIYNPRNFPLKDILLTETEVDGHKVVANCFDSIETEGMTICIPIAYTVLEGIARGCPTRPAPSVR